MCKNLEIKKNLHIFAKRNIVKPNNSIIMRVYDLKKLEKCFVCGNIDRNMDRFIGIITSRLSKYTKEEHPKELERQERLKKRAYNEGRGGIFAPRNPRRFDEEMRNISKKMKSSSFFGDNYNDSVIVVSGNCGIGSKSMKYYQDIFEKLDRILADNNCFVFFVRGNNDDPSMFNEEKINFEHVKTIPDYSVILLKNFNCLCIGGSVSLDKEWKLSQEKEFGKKLFWEGEQPYFDEKTLDEILGKYKISCVISSTSPSFAFPGTNAFNKSKWFKENASIKGMVSNERKILDKIYDKILDADIKPYAWFYGRFKQNNQAKVNDIIFNSLHSFQIENVANLIATYFGIDASKKLGDNVFALDSFLAEEEQRETLPRFRMPHDGDEPDIEDEEENEGFAEEAEEGGADRDRYDGGMTIEAPVNGLYGNYRLTTEDVTNALNQVQAQVATARTQVNVNEMRWEMPQYTINNGMIEMVRNDG
jgi:hypothetical protein